MNLRRIFSLALPALMAAGLLQARDWDPIPGRNPPPDRYKNYHELLAKGKQAKVVAATFFGSEGYEEFTGAAELADGAMAAFGNAWGPAFPAEPKPVMLGQGGHKGLKPVKTDTKGKESPAHESPDCTGFLAFYEPELKGLRKVVKFDWGVASITTGRATPDGQGLLIAGRCTAAFASLKEKVGAFHTQAVAGGGGYTYEGVSLPGDVYVARLAADGEKIEWAWVLQAANDPPDRLYTDREGAVYFDVRGLRKIGKDGQECKTIADKTHSGVSRWLAVDPKDGSAYFGGDRNTRTNKEPWRQPYFYKYDAQGQKVWALWEFSSKEVGSDHGGLESDSSVRGAAFRPDGLMIVAGWSDGGNSVFQRWATDWKKNCPDSPLGWTPWWPKGANSYAHVMLLDQEKKETKVHLWWCGYLPMNFEGGPSFANRTSGQSIRWVESLADGSVAWTGGSATGLIQTPNAFWKDPGTGKKYGGETCVVLNQDLSAVVFSSYLPGLNDARPAPTKQGLLVASRSTNSDGRDPPTPSPSVKALQDFKGAADAHLFLLEVPMEPPKAPEKRRD